MVGGDDDVGGGGKTEIVERLAQLRQIVVGVLDAGHRGRPVDAGRHGVEAVAGIVLGAIGIARPENQHERLAARLEHRQHDLAGDVGEIGLLRDVGHRSARRLGVARLGIVAAGGCRQRKVGLGERLLHFVRQRNAGLGAGGIIDHDRMQAGTVGAVGVVENQRRADLADRGGAEALGAGHLQDGLLVQVIAAEMLIDVAQHRIVFEERHDGIARGRGRKAGIDGVGEIAGIAEIVARGHRRSVGGGEGREHRVRILEIDALVADIGHGWCRLRRDDLPAQPVRHEQDQVMGGVVLG